ncbi:MAG: hypothetical protein K2O03_08740, partial [Lachnospiraceae bacterium]|nr:hypothetical protein [Lachnospiraceae bacterium]
VRARTVRRAISRIGAEYLPLLFLLQEADLNAQNPALLPDKLRQLDEARRMAEKILSEKQCVCLKDLALNGSDLIALGVEPGREIGRILAELLDYVIEYPEKNNREELLAQAGKIMRMPPKPPLPKPNPIQYM